MNVFHCLLWCGLNFPPYTVITTRVSVAFSLFISKLMDQFSFWERRLLMIASFTLCSRRAFFSDVLESVVLKKFSGGKPPIVLFSSAVVLKYCKNEVYMPPVQRSLRACC